MQRHRYVSVDFFSDELFGAFEADLLACFFAGFLSGDFLSGDFLAGDFLAGDVFVFFCVAFFGVVPVARESVGGWAVDV